MGSSCDTSKNKKKKELYPNQNSLSPLLFDKAKKSICKITIENNGKIINGTGFFIKINDSMKCLITSYHIIHEEMVNKDIEIEIYNQKKMKLNLNNNCKYYSQPYDVTVIEIKNNDELYYKVEYFNLFYNLSGYSIFKNVDIFSIEHLSEKVESSIGKIINIHKSEFTYTLSTNKGSSGSPILLLNNNNNINSILVIGMSKRTDYSNKINYGIFIADMFKEDKNLNINLNNNNYILAEINVITNHPIRLINSYEEYKKHKRKYKSNNDIKETEKNEEEINKCEISINGELIPFCYTFQFKKKGKNTIKYTFKNYLTKTNYMFYGCEFLTSIDLSNFNSQFVTNMSNMFFGCESLTCINLSNFSTQNVTNMRNMFWGCKSLPNIDLSNFNIQNVFILSGMFCGCESLTSLNLSNFNTQNVYDMSCLFCRCNNLREIDLSEFNTQSVANMSYMFAGCANLKEIDLSGFNTQNVGDMNSMFWGCCNLKKIDLSNFDGQNIDNVNFMFCGCRALKSLKLFEFNRYGCKNKEDMFLGCDSL